MKLLTKTTLYFATISLFVFFFGGIIFYNLIQSLVKSQTDKELVSSMHQVVFELKDNMKHQDSLIILFHDRMQLEEVKKITVPGFVFKDTVLFDSFESRYLSFRSLTHETNLHEKKLRFVFYKPLSTTNELVEKMAVAILFMTLIFLASIFLFNKYFLNRIWSDFFSTLNWMKDFHITNAEPPKLPPSDIQEFQLLISVFEKMTNRIHKDYINLTEFIENTSHEIQTPLAIIKTKTDLLIQEENLSENQMKLIESIHSTTLRLSKLNKTLSLLSKIENQQFTDVDDVHLKHVLESHLDNFEELIENQHIEVSRVYVVDKIIKMDANLAGILTINLLKNAIHHNIPKGKIQIYLDQEKLQISNTGELPIFSEQDIFKRFTKSFQKADSTGLGLAITKNICDNYGFRIGYRYENDLHCFEIIFPD